MPLSHLRKNLSAVAKKAIPKSLYMRAYFLRACYYDAQRYMRHSAWDGVIRSPTALDAKITKEYHRLEKGMALPKPRPGFGQDCAADVVKACRERLALSPPSAMVPAALDAVERYLEFNRSLGVELSELERQTAALRRSSPRIGNSTRGEDTVESVQRSGLPVRENGASAFHTSPDPASSPATALADTLPEAAALSQCGGIRMVDKAELTEIPPDVFRRFAFTRHSIRNFAPGQVPLEEIQAAVEIANRSPSVCNRQAWKVHALRGKQKEAALRLQNGNRGFEDSIDTVLIVTMDVRAFAGTIERYQAWIDGGMYAMALVYALHSRHLGTCCLNWSVEPRTDRSLHGLISLPEQETVIMYIAVGLLKEQFAVAWSHRKSVGATLVVHSENT